MRRSRKILIAVALAFGVAALIAVVRHYQLRAAVAGYIAELEARGEPMTLAQVIPAPVPAEQNGAPLITNALEQLSLESDYTNSIVFNNDPAEMSVEIVPGKRIVGWREPLIHDPTGDYPTNTWEDLGAQLAARRDAFHNLRRLIALPTLDFEYNYSSPGEFIPQLAPRLSQIKVAVQWLGASELYHMHGDNTASACADVRTMLALVKGQTHERFEISQLVRAAMVRQMVANATWEILQATNVPAEDLAQLQQDWQSLQFIVPLKNAFLFERVTELRLVTQLRNSPANLPLRLGPALTQRGYRYKNTGEGRVAKWVLVDESPFFKRVLNKVRLSCDVVLWRGFWSYTDELRELEMWQALLEGTHLFETNRSFQSLEAFERAQFGRLGLDSVTNDPYAILSQHAYGQLHALRSVATAGVARNLAVTAIALKRYQTQYHHLPDKLEDLVPAFLESVPVDWMDGQPLRYRRNDDWTFALYSVGEDGKDDGGNPRPLEGSISSYWLRGRDWVWPQPASRREVQAYQDQTSTRKN